MFDRIRKALGGGADARGGGASPAQASPISELLFANWTPGSPVPVPDLEALRARLDTPERDAAIGALRQWASGGASNSRGAAWASRVLAHAGERVEPGPALGAVVEARVNDGIDYVAAYADGTARYINFSGATIVWEAPADPEVAPAVAACVAIATGVAPFAIVRARTPFASEFRASILLPQGNAELTHEDARGNAQATAALNTLLNAAQRLMMALIDRSAAARRKDGAS